MRIEETSALLAKIQAFDNRNVDEAVLSAWFEVVAPHTLRDCLDAVTDYFRTNTSWIMPAHVVERVRATEQERLRGFRDGLHLNRVDEDRAVDWSGSMRALNRAAATGALTPSAYTAYQDSEQTLEAVLTRKALS